MARSLSLGVPLENLLVVVFEFAIKYRDTMDPKIRDRWDLMLLEDYEGLRAHLKRTGKWLGNVAEEINERIGGPDGK
jgi:hypothetical protein